MLTLNQMVQHLPPTLDATFAALSDATRRGVIEQLVRRDHSVTELAARFGITLTGMKKHLAVLEQAGLVESEKVGRVRTCRLGPRDLGAELQWLAHLNTLWATRFDALDHVLNDLKAKEKTDG